MHGLARISAILLLILILPITASVQILPVLGSIAPNPGLTISISNPQRFTNTQNRDFSPAVVQGLDGTAWVFWSYVAFNGRSSLPIIDYRTSSNPSTVYSASAWSGNQVLSQTPLSQNVSPSVSQYRNGTVYVSFGSNRTGNYNIFLEKYSPGIGWSGDQQATLSTLDQIGSSVVAASDGSLWLFYDRSISPTTANIYYKVFHGGFQAQETQLTFDTSSIRNTQPSAFQMNDGSMWLVWTKTDATGVGTIYYEVYRNGAWGAPAALTSGLNSDSHPAISQDSNTTIWVAWSRDLPVGSNSFQFDVFYNYSVNGGASWAGETNLTNDVGCSAPCPDDMNPNFAQMKDGRIYLFWSSNRDPQMYWNLYYATTNPQPFHNVAVTSLSVGPLKLRDGGLAVINVTVADLGTFPESFFVFIRATNTSTTTVAAQYLSLAAGQYMSLAINWNTGSVKWAKYRISAYIPPAANEIVTGDNTLTAPGIVWLVPPADVNMDGRVDILDAALIGVAYGSTPGKPNWNPAADLNEDGRVDILDAALVAYYYGAIS